jgi:hypothetical protein
MEANTKVAVVRKSQKGTWGKVGAPTLTVKLPPGKSFTMKKAVEHNPGMCALTVIKDINSRLNGFKFTGLGKAKRKVKVPVTLSLGEKIPQPDGKVGRPSYRFVKLAVAKPAPAPKAVKLPKAVKPSVQVVKVNSTPLPVVSPVVNTPSVVTPAPVVEAPVAVVTPTPLP